MENISDALYEQDISEQDITDIMNVIIRFYEKNINTVYYDSNEKYLHARNTLMKIPGFEENNQCLTPKEEQYGWIRIDDRDIIPNYAQTIRFENIDSMNFTIIVDGNDTNDDIDDTEENIQLEDVITFKPSSGTVSIDRILNLIQGLAGPDCLSPHAIFYTGYKYKNNNKGIIDFTVEYYSS